MKRYITPITEIVSVRPANLLDSSVLEGSQGKSGFMSKKKDSFFDTSKEYNANAWTKGFSDWEE